MRRRNLLSPLQLLAQQSLPRGRSINAQDVDRLLNARGGRTPTFFDKDLSVRFQVRPEEYDAVFTQDFLNELSDNPMSRDRILERMEPDSWKPNSSAETYRPQHDGPAGFGNYQYPFGVGNLTTDVSHHGGWNARFGGGLRGYGETLLYSRNPEEGSRKHFTRLSRDGTTQGPYAHARYNFVNPNRDGTPGELYFRELQSDFSQNPIIKEGPNAYPHGDLNDELAHLRMLDLDPFSVPNFLQELGLPHLEGRVNKEGYTNFVTGGRTPVENPDDYRQIIRELNRVVDRYDRLSKARPASPFDNIWDRTTTNTVLDNLSEHEGMRRGPVQIVMPDGHTALEDAQGIPRSSHIGHDGEMINLYKVFNKIYNNALPNNMTRAFRNLGFDPQISEPTASGPRTNHNYTPGQTNRFMTVTPNMWEKIDEMIKKYGSAFAQYKKGGLV